MMKRLLAIILLIAGLAGLSPALAPSMQAQGQSLEQLSPEARRLLDLCDSVGLRSLDTCVIGAYYHTVRSWAMGFARTGRKLAWWLMILELIVLGYVYVAGRKREVETILPKLAWRLIIFSLVFYGLTQYWVVFDGPSWFVRTILTELAQNTQGGAGLSISQESLQSLLPDAQGVANGVIVQAMGVFGAGVEFFARTLRNLVTIEFLYNNTLLFIPIIGMVVMFGMAVPAGLILYYTVELYVGLMLGGLLLAFSVFKGTRMIPASILDILVSGTIRLLLLLMMTSLLMVFSDFTLDYLMYWENLPQARQMIENTYGVAFSALGLRTIAITGVMMLIVAATTVFLPSAITRKIMQYVSFNMRDVLDD